VYVTKEQVVTTLVKHLKDNFIAKLGGWQRKAAKGVMFIVELNIKDVTSLLTSAEGNDLIKVLLRKAMTPEGNLDLDVLQKAWTAACEGESDILWDSGEDTKLTAIFGRMVLTNAFVDDFFSLLRTKGI